MAFQEDKTKLIAYIVPSIRRSENEQELEEFFCWIDSLEEKAVEDAQYYRILADAYMEAGDAVKAKEAFSKIYNPKNKKDMKKFVSYDSVGVKPVIRPSRRAKELPQFRYVDSRMLKNKFQLSEECACCICKGKTAALYVGTAYSEDSDEISFMHREDKFCADCIQSGAAAEELNLQFNNPLLKDCTAYDSEKINELLYQTPECSAEFDFYEDIWPGCCGDFCRYVGYEDEYEEKHHFQCIHCGKKIVWTNWT